MHLLKSLLTVTTLSMLGGCIVIATPSHADYHVQKNYNLSTTSLTELEVDTGAGSLIIQGDSALTEIQVTADIYTEKEYKDNYVIDLYESNGKAYFIAKTKSSAGSWVGSSPHIDIVMHVPAHMMLDVEDGSGNTTIENIDASVTIDDGSGELTMSNISGNTEIIDGSGELTIRDIGGNVDIKDGSGALSLTNVDGNVTINDGSGEIVVQEVIGAVNIDDGSGDLTVLNTKDSVVIDDGSGDITVKNVASLRILESGSGSLKVKDVKGGFDIDG